MHIRKLVKAGQASHTVSLPKEWLSKNKLQKGDTLYILPKSDTELIISSKQTEQKQEKKEIDITVDGKEIDTVQREITSAYLNNYNTITLIGEDITSKTKAIRKILHDFVALEISEQTSMRIIAKDLLNLQEISLSKTINRMDLIIRTMLDDSKKAFTEKKLHESIRFRDYDVNRLYFLAARLLKGSLQNPNLAKQLEIKQSETLLYWNLIVNLENLADYVKNISEISKTKTHKGKGFSCEDKKIKEVIAILQQNYLDVMKARHKNDKNQANSVIKRRKEVYIKCNKINNVEINSVIREMTTCINNIAKIIIDKE